MRSLGCGLAAGAVAWFGWVGDAGAEKVGADDPVPPSLTYGALYRAVEMPPVFIDSKTFPDMVPVGSPKAAMAAFAAASVKPEFNVNLFATSAFDGPRPGGPVVEPAAKGTALPHYVSGLWSVLTQTATQVPAYSTLLPLPFPYVVPGGRFREVYYWDSYFVMLGLEGDGRTALADDMLKDFAFEIDRYGHVPNANRSYCLGRSQPPMFALMVDLVARREGPAVYRRYLPELVREWQYWMRGADGLAPGRATLHAVRLADGTVLNRYWDERAAPRDEAFREDVATAGKTTRPAEEVWRNLRATAESGWDFSSRWLADGETLPTDRVIDLLPPDLNSLLVHLEETIGHGYLLEGDLMDASLFYGRAVTRAAAIDRLMFDPKMGAYGDYLWREGKTTGMLTAATMFPLFLQLASPAEAATVAATVQRSLLETGGLGTTTVQNGQQWDRPNGWAPMQWVAVMGLRRYGMNPLAETIATRWVEKTIAGYAQSGSLVEKYDVAAAGGDAGFGGEYATQIGFGWTNGVLVGLTGLYPALRVKAERALAP